KLLVENYKNLGSKQNGIVITPEVAAQRTMSSRTAFSQAMVKEKENFEIRTGNIYTESGSTNSEIYRARASRMRQNIQIRTQSHLEEIYQEHLRIQQPHGYCYKYWRNTQKCIQDSLERAKELGNRLEHYNKVDTARAEEYD